MFNRNRKSVQFFKHQSIIKTHNNICHLFDYTCSLIGLLYVNRSEVRCKISRACKNFWVSVVFKFGWKVVVDGIYVVVLNVVVEFSNTVVGIDVEAVETSSGVVVGLCVVDVVASSVVIVGFFVVVAGAVEPFSVVVVGLCVVDVETPSVVVKGFPVVEVGAVELSSVVVVGSCVVVLI